MFSDRADVLLARVHGNRRLGRFRRWDPLAKLLSPSDRLDIASSYHGSDRPSNEYRVPDTGHGPKKDPRAPPPPLSLRGHARRRINEGERATDVGAVPRTLLRHDDSFHRSGASAGYVRPQCQHPGESGSRAAQLRPMCNQTPNGHGLENREIQTP